MAAVQAAAASPAFLARLPPTLTTAGPRPAADVVESILDALGVDRTGVEIAAEWHPATRQLRVWARVARPADQARASR